MCSVVYTEDRKMQSTCDDHDAERGPSYRLFLLLPKSAELLESGVRPFDLCSSRLLTSQAWNPSSSWTVRSTSVLLTTIETAFHLSSPAQPAFILGRPSEAPSADRQVPSLDPTAVEVWTSKLQARSPWRDCRRVLTCDPTIWYSC